MSVINKLTVKKTKTLLAKAPEMRTKTVPERSVSVKEEAKAMIDRLPDDLTWERLIYHIAVRTHLEEALKQIEDGNYYSEEEMNEYFDKWLGEE